jgi:hypothetical protein
MLCRRDFAGEVAELEVGGWGWSSWFSAHGRCADVVRDTMEGTAFPASVIRGAGVGFDPGPRLPGPDEVATLSLVWVEPSRDEPRLGGHGLLRAGVSTMVSEDAQMALYGMAAAVLSGHAPE